MLINRSYILVGGFNPSEKILVNWNDLILGDIVDVSIELHFI